MKNNTCKTYLNAYFTVINSSLIGDVGSCESPGQTPISDSAVSFVWFGVPETEYNDFTPEGKSSGYISSRCPA